MRIEKNRERLLGKQFQTLTSGTCTIIDYKGTYDVTVEFEYPHFIRKTTLSKLKAGKVKNPMYPSVCGKGYFGVGEYSNKGGDRSLYLLWKGMISRCYADTTKKSTLVYEDVEVCNEWLNFQNFAKWCANQQFYGCKDEKGRLYQLDKDILFRGNKVYSPETCCFVPRSINCLLLFSKGSRGNLPVGVSYVKSLRKYRADISRRNISDRVLGYFNTLKEAFEVYKVTRERYIKNMAEIWRDRIDERVYQALLNYEVHIDD